MRLVDVDGYLVCTGVDIDVRTTVMHELGWEPMIDRVEQVHWGDNATLAMWPWEYWSIEPIDQRLDDWQFRYCTIFRRPR